MDRSRRRPGRLIALLVAGCCAAAAAPPPAAPPLRAMRWLAPGVDASSALTRRPTECLAEPRDADAAYLVELGRAAFRTPLLLGGQAARAGLRCETCHSGGRRNLDFDFPGLTGAPGTADVTTSVLSSHRGDGIFNPKPIPDLTGPKAAMKISQDPGSGALEAFIHGVITQEFDGNEPPPAVLRGLAAYVRSLSPQACPAASTESVTVDGALADVRRATRAAVAALARGDNAAAALMVEAARSQLGDIDERYAGPDLVSERSLLEQAARDLGAAEGEAQRGAGSEAAEDLTLWLAAAPRWEGEVRARAARSLYDPRRLGASARLAAIAGR